jgi:hypothetical protein
MSKKDKVKVKGIKGPPPTVKVTTDDIMESGNYSLVEVATETPIGPAIFVRDSDPNNPMSLHDARVAAVKKLAMTAGKADKAGQSTPDMREIGFTGTSIWYNLMRQDYNPELRGQQGLRMYDQMRRNDAMVRSTLRLAKTPVMAARWFVQPSSMSTKDVKIGSYVESNLMKWMTISWQQVLIEALLQLDFGYYMFEKVFDFHPSGNGKIIWKKLAPRHPMDVLEWEYDPHGGPAGGWFYDPDNAEGDFIPIKKLLVFSNDKEAGNVEGISLLRSAYKHWYFKDNLYKIDAIQKERHGIGIPIIKLPLGFNNNDKTVANDLGANLRTNEKAHVVLPPNWEIEFAELKGQPTDAIASINHHNEQIGINILAPFLTNSGAGQSENTQEMFYKATRHVAESIRDIFNKHAIPELVDYNWKNIDPDDYPTLRVRRIGDAIDWRAVSFAIRNFIGAGVLVPDATLEDYIRDEMDLPGVDVATARVQAMPQAPSGAMPGMANIPTVDDPVSGISQTPAAVPMTTAATTPPKAPVAGPPRQKPVTAKKRRTGTSGGADRAGK